MSELQRFDPNVPATQPLGNAWLKPQRLNDPLTTIFCVPQYLTSRPSQLSPASVFLDIFAAATTICVHRSAQSQVREDPVSAEIISQSRKQCLEVAFNVFRLMEMTCHWDLRVVSCTQVTCQSLPINANFRSFTLVSHSVYTTP